MLSGAPILSDVLQAHKNSIIKKINGITDLNQMTNAFLSGVVRESLVDPLVVHFDKISKSIHNIEIDGAAFPFDFLVERGRMYTKQVARISIPFSGDRNLLQVNPGGMPLNHPQGEVNGNMIQFDVLLWGSADDADRAKQQIEKNVDLLKQFATSSNGQMKVFNESLPAQLKAAFVAKLEALTKQHAIFDDLGIPDESPVPVAAQSVASPIASSRKRGKARAVQIIQYIENQFVQQLNQTNSNVGDVNNAIQSN
jgi:hypothetical protein